MNKVPLVFGSACLLAMFGWTVAHAQNVLGAERGPSDPAEVQRQLERQRHDLDAMNRRTSDCGPRNEDALGTPATGQQAGDTKPPSPETTCAP